MFQLARRYGANPLHLLALLGCFALAGFALFKINASPSTTRIALWLGGAVIAHDLVLYPLYALADRSLDGVRRRNRRAAPGSVNWVRVPVLLAGVLLLIWYPLITGHAVAYRNRTGLPPQGYLLRYLLVVAALFLGSAVLFALTRRRHR